MKNYKHLFYHSEGNKVLHTSQYDLSDKQYKQLMTDFFKAKSEALHLRKNFFNTLHNSAFKEFIAPPKITVDHDLNGLGIFDQGQHPYLDKPPPSLHQNPMH